MLRCRDYIVLVLDVLSVLRLEIEPRAWGEICTG